MTRRVWLRCILISVLLGALLPLVLVIPMAPAEGESVIDVGAFSAETMSELARESPSRWFELVPRREVHGFERYTYWFTSDDGWLLYVSVAGLCAVGCLVATVWVSYLNTRGS